MKDNEYILHHIISGKVNLNIDNQNITISPPSYEDIYKAAELYEKVYRRGFLFGALSKEEIIHYLINRGLWSIENELELEKIPDQISNAKLDMYNTYTRFGNVETKRKVLTFLNNKYNDLWAQKGQFDRFTIEGISNYHKICYLLCCGAAIDYNKCDINLNKLFYTYINNTYNDTTIRQVAKSDDWRNYWRGIKLGFKIFGDILTRDQYSLLSWSQFYDNIYESGECPNDEIIEDDDLLDGWCIFQRKKRKEDEKKRLGDKYKGSGEIFIPVETPEQAAKVNAMNDQKARMIKRQREQLIVQKGTVLEQDMPDSKIEIRQQAMQEFKNRSKR